MNHSQLIALMHAVLDNEASAEQAQELERQLGSDPAARAEFDELRWLFDGLARVPQGFPPEGLVASVMVNIAQNSAERGGSDQPFAPSGVFEADLKKARGRGAGLSQEAGQGFQPWAFLRGDKMSEKGKGPLGNRKVWIGGGVAVAAAVVAVATGVFPPSASDTAGTIVPAQRYRAPQAQDIQVGAQPAGAAQGASSSGATNQLREQLGNERAVVGTERATVGTERGNVGTERGAVGTERGAVGTERGSVGTERGSVGTERGSVGTERGTVGTERGTVGTERGTVGTERSMMGTERSMMGTERAYQGTERSEH